MSRRSTTFLKTALAAAHYTGAGNLLAPYTRGASVIFMLHQVDPTPPRVRAQPDPQGARQASLKTLCAR